MTKRPDHEWEELFRQELSDEPLRPEAAARARLAVRQAITESRRLEAASRPNIWRRLNLGGLFRFAPLAVGALALVALLVVSSLLPAPPPRASMLVTGGLVTLTDGDTGLTQRLEDGATASLKPGDEVVAETGTADIVYFTGKSTELRPGAQAQLIALSQEDGGQQVELLVRQGQAQTRVFGWLGPTGRFQINTLSAQTTVTGTEFFIEARSASETFIAAQSGSVKVKVGDQEVTVRAGEQALAVVGQPIEVKIQDAGALTMQTLLDQIIQLIGAYVPSIVGAVVILVLGWLVASIVSGVVRGLLKRTGVGGRLSKLIGAGDGGAQAEDAVAKAVFYLIMLFVMIAFFQTLRLDLITQPLNNLLTELLGYLPRLLGAGMLLLVAWVIATVLRRLLTQMLSLTNLDERFGSPGLAKTLGDVTYYLVFLLFLPGVLDALSLPGLLTPIQGMINTLLGFVPNLAAAGIIVAVGLFLARLLRQIVANLLAAVGVDRLSERLGVASALGQQKVSGLLGLVVYVLILLPIITAALNALNLESLTRPVSEMLNQILGVVPSLFAAFVILALAYVVGRVVSGLVADLLSRAGFDSIFARLGLGQLPASGQRGPSQVTGYLVLAAVMLFAGVEASRVAGLARLSDLLNQFVGFSGQVLLGIIIFGIGLYLSNLVAEAVRASNMKQAVLLALTARIAVLVLAGAMALRQMGLANEIINLAFGLLIGAIAVAAAIAFGLGGRETAGRLLDEWSHSLKSDESSEDKS